MNNIMDQEENNINNKFIKRSSLNKLFFQIKNNNYEVTIMWALLIITIILLFFYLVDEANDEYETLRIIGAV